MKKALFLFSLAASVFFMAPATAQEKKLFTPEDASYNNRAIYAQRPNQLQWIGGTDILMKVKGNEIVTMNPDKKKETSFLTLDQMNAYANKGGADSLRRIPSLSWLSDYQAYFFAMGKEGIDMNCLDLKQKTIKKTTTVPIVAENH
ncbi:MAG: hypothetical protein HUK16_02945, partial [Bacteroidales bacterium]|nr:hypothetical protein [Bacteroidales bacterium]